MKFLVPIGIVLLITTAFFIGRESVNNGSTVESKTVPLQSEEMESTFVEPILTSSLNLSFEEESILYEVGKMNDTQSPYWWLNSGGLFFSRNGVAQTIQGELEESNFWRTLYAKNNPRDTDNGYHPQNIFRLVTRERWMNLQQEASFRIIKDNLSESSYRNDSNGLLFFNRYQDGNNLYYTGIRVDGYAVIKKKIKGAYFTMAYAKIFDGQYDREKSPNVLPHDIWLNLRSEVKNEEDGSVSIRLFLDENRSGDWQLIAEAKDDGKRYGGAAIKNEGYAGIRTDFMDVEFDNYKIEELREGF